MPVEVPADEESPVAVVVETALAFLGQRRIDERLHPRLVSSCILLFPGCPVGLA
jgi:hypothetical protein